MISVISAGIAPGVALLAFFYLKDRVNSEPLSMVFRSFITGGLLVIPIMFLEYTFVIEGVGQSPFVKSFLLTGLMEEFVKWFIFLYTIYKHVFFDEHYDGIVYGVSISLGFATVENLLYLLANGIEYAFGRALFPVSSHALFGVIMGFYFGKSKFKRKHPKQMIAIALILPAVLHGLYDFILSAVQSNWLYVMVPFMIMLWALALRKVKLANQERKVVHLDQRNKWTGTI